MIILNDFLFCIDHTLRKTWVLFKRDVVVARLSDRFREGPSISSERSIGSSLLVKINYYEILTLATKKVPMKTST